MTKNINRKKHGGPAPSGAVRNMLRNFEASNRAERRYVSPEALEKQIRALVQRESPDLNGVEIEKRVARRLARGLKPHCASQ